MKKNIFFTMLFALVTLVMTSCSKDSEGLSKIIEYPKITVLGDAFYVSPLGQPFVDPGCTVEYNGGDYTSNLVVIGADEIDINTAGLYDVIYSATSPDGYTWSEKRTVAVCDPSITTDLSGTWNVDPTSYRIYNGAEAAMGGAYAVKISKLAPGIFKFSDLFGGWYDQRAGYGAAYAIVGQMQLTADNKVICLSSSYTPWGENLIAFENSVYDPATETITWDAIYNDSKMTFHIILHKK